MKRVCIEKLGLLQNFNDFLKSDMDNKGQDSVPFWLTICPQFKICYVLNTNNYQNPKSVIAEFEAVFILEAWYEAGFLGALV